MVGSHSCAVTTAGAVKCWGSNGRGGWATGCSRPRPVGCHARRRHRLTSGVTACGMASRPWARRSLQPLRDVPRNSDKCLDVVYASADAGRRSSSALPWRANQQWRLQPVSNGAVRIIAHHGQVLAIYGGLVDDVRPTNQFPWHGGDNQRWTIEPASNSYLFIVARHSGKVLDVELRRWTTATVIQYTVDGGANQQWLLRAVAPN